MHCYRCSCPSWQAFPPAYPPLLADLADLLAQDGEVLRELDHDDDEQAPHQHAGGPEERLEDRAATVQLAQQNRLLLLQRVVEAWHLLLRPQPFADVHDQRVHHRLFLLALRHVKALRERQRERAFYHHIRGWLESFCCV